MVKREIEVDDDGDLEVWAVRYGNYEPMETNSIWFNKEQALERAASLGSMWEVERTWVYADKD